MVMTWSLALPFCNMSWAKWAYGGPILSVPRVERKRFTEEDEDKLIKSGSCTGQRGQRHFVLLLVFFYKVYN